MFSEMDSINSELHRKELLQQSAADRMIHSAKTSGRRRSFQFNGEWMSVRHHWLRYLWSSVMSFFSLGGITGRQMGQQ